MAEIILSQFHKDNAPIVGLSPTITIKILDGAVVINGENMVEDANGRYYYEFVDYNKKYTYEIDVDGGSDELDDRYQHTTNMLDAYPNKGDWKGGGAGTYNQIDTKQLALDVWNVKTKNFENKDGTMGKHLIQLDTNAIIEEISSIEIPDNEKSITDNIIKAVETLGTSINETIENSIEDLKGHIDSKEEDNDDLIEEIKETRQTLGIKISENKQSIIEEIKNKKIEKIDYEKIASFYKEVNFDGLFKFMGELKTIISDTKNKVDGLKNIDYSIIDVYLKSNSKSLYDIVNVLKTQITDGNNELKEYFKDNQILEQIEEVKKNLDTIHEVETKIGVENNEQLKEFTQDLYKKSMKYLVYVAKNIGGIAKKNDLLELKK